MHAIRTNMFQDYSLIKSPYLIAYYRFVYDQRNPTRIPNDSPLIFGSREVLINSNSVWEVNILRLCNALETHLYNNGCTSKYNGDYVPNLYGSSTN